MCSLSLSSDRLLDFLQYDISSSLLEVCLSKKSKSNHFLLFDLFLRNVWPLNYKRSVTLESSLDLKICSKFTSTLHFLSLSVRILFWKDALLITRLGEWPLKGLSHGEYSNQCQIVHPPPFRALIWEKCLPNSSHFSHNWDGSTSGETWPIDWRQLVRLLQIRRKNLKLSLNWNTSFYQPH